MVTDWIPILQGTGIAGVIFALGANWMKLVRMGKDLDEIKRMTSSFPALHATLTHQHEWLERLEREIHDIRSGIG